MSDFAVFDCTAILPREKVAQFKDLFYHKGKDKGEKNFGVIANWTEEELSDNRVEITFDCQNGKGIYFGWYKTEINGKNMEKHCDSLRVERLLAFNDWQVPKTENEYWLYLQSDGLTLVSQRDLQATMKVDVQNGIDYVERKIYKEYIGMRDSEIV